MDENFQDLLADNTEAAIDLLLENEIIKEIPILGSSLKLVRGIQNLRDRAYLNKIRLFAEKVGEINDGQKQRLISESKKSEKSRAKFGDAIFTTLEQSDSAIKVEYTAIAFEAFLNNDFDESDLRLICHVIKNSFADELIDVVENDLPTTDLKYVVASGLAETIHKPLTYDGSAEPKYELSGIAKLMKNAWSKYNTK